MEFVEDVGRGRETGGLALADRFDDFGDCEGVDGGFGGRGAEFGEDVVDPGVEGDDEEEAGA